MGYTKTAIKGISWMGALRVIVRLITIGRIAILARLLNPFAFGLFGIADLMTTFLETTTETGINVVLIQERDGIDKYISSAWMVSIVRGVLISIILACFSPLIAFFFHSPSATGLIIFMSTVPLIRGFINPAIVKLQKELKFQLNFIYTLISFFISTITSIVACLILKNAYGLVMGLVAAALAEVIMSFIMATPRPTFAINREYLKLIFHSGKWVTMAGISEYLFQNLDNIVVGRLLGVSALGLYDMGYTISMAPITEGTNVLAQVTFPLYVKMAGDRTRLKKAFTKTMSILALLTVPAGLVLFAFPTQIVTIFLGNKWLAIVPFLRILAISGIIRSLSNLTASAFMALKAQKRVALLSFISFIILAITIVPLVLKFGLMGAALSVLTVSVVVFPLSLYYLRQLFNHKEST